MLRILSLLFGMVTAAPTLSADTPECLISFDSATLDVCNGRLSLVNDDLRYLGDEQAFADAAIRIVKFSAPVTSEQRAALNGLGVEILGYVPFYGYKVRMPASLDQRVRAIAGVRWTGPYLPVWKIELNLANELKDGRILEPADAVDSLWVSLHPGESAARTRDLLAAIPGTAFRFQGRGHDHEFLVLGFERPDLEAIVTSLALDEAVNAISFHWPNELLNSQGPWLHQSGQDGQVPIFDRGIYGCGQITAALDSGLHTAHCSFRDAAFGDPVFDTCSDGAGCPAITPDFNHRKIGAHYKWSGRPGGPGDEHGHGTFVSGNLIGSNPPDVADCENLTTPGGLTNLDGAAPGAQMIIQEAGPGLQYLNSLGGTLYHAATVAYQNGARIHNNSWGSGCRANNICQPGCQVGYRPHSRGGDMAVWENPGLLIFAAAGNSGGGQGNPGCGLGADVGAPGNAKNVFSIGATQRGALGHNMAGFSSRGPVLDRRTKPDMVAQGQSLVSASVSTCGTASNQGTSFASPTAAGLGALVREYLQRGFYPLGVENAAFAIPNPSAALVKAIMINGSSEIDGAGTSDGFPDQNQGWGRILLDRSLYFESDDRRLWLHDGAGGLQTGQLDSHFLDVQAGEPLAVTLVWHDFPAEEGANPHIVNMLRLEVETPSGQVWTQKLSPGGGLSDANPFQGTTDADYDDRNTVHQIVLDNPQAGVHEVRVRAVQVAMGDTQPYALAATGDLLGIAEPDFILQPDPARVEVCQGTDAGFGIGVLGVLEFEDPVALSIEGVPAGGGIGFSVNPVVPADPAAFSALTIGATAAIAPGDYSLVLTGTSDGPEFDPAVRTRALGLRVDEPLTAPALLTPADAAADLIPRPAFSWQGTADFVYRIQVATGDDFAAPAIDQQVSGTVFTPVEDLALGSQYFWRVQGVNACGEGDWSDVFSFTTRLQPVAEIDPEAMVFTVPAGDGDAAVLEIGNTGTGNLVWSLVADGGAGRGHDTGLDETFELPDFQLNAPVNGGQPAVFSFTAGALGRGEVVGFSFAGTAAGVSGSGTWASNTCMIVETPGGEVYRVGGAHGATPGCGPAGRDARWDFQGTASTNNGVYQSLHDSAFEPARRDVGEWTLTFVHDFNVGFAETIAWSDVSFTLHKVPLAYCLEAIDAPGWLSVTPQAGTTAAGDVAAVTVSIDSAGLPIGTYEAGLCLTTNAENTERVVIPVELVVAPPATFGSVEGVVRGVNDCTGEPASPLPGASVTVTGQTGTHALESGTGGGYQLFLDAADGPLEIEVNAPGYHAATAAAVPIGAGDATVRDFELSLDAACIELDPEQLAVTLESGQSDTRALTVGNTGTQTLEWAIQLENPGPTPGATQRELLRAGVLLMTGDDYVRAFDPHDGALLDERFLGAEAMGLVRHFLLHPDGERLLATTGQDVIYAFDLDGNNLGVFAPAGGPDTSVMQNIRQMVIHPATGKLLVATASGGNPSTIAEFDLDGNYLGNFIDNAAGGISAPASIVIRDADVLVSATGNNIYRYQHDGTFIEVWNGGINNPRQIVALEDGNVLAATFGAPSGVWELDADGNQVGLYDPATLLTGVYPLGNGNLFVTNTTGVHVIDRDNNLVATVVEGPHNLRWISPVRTLDCNLPDWLEVAPLSGSVQAGGPAVAVTVSVDAGQLTPGQYTAGICVAGNDPARPVVEVPVSLTVVAGAPAPALVFDPASLDFGDVALGDTTPPLTALLHNEGDAGATGLDFATPGEGFIADTSDCGASLPAGQSCEISVLFTPQAIGPAAATLEVGADQDAGAALALAGNGTDPDAPAMSVVVREGDDIPGYGTVINIHDITVNDHGDWLAEVSYAPPGGGSPRLILKNGEVLIAAGDPVDPPPTVINPPAGTSTVFKALNNHGGTALQLTLAEGPASSGVYHNLSPVLLQGQISSAPQLSPDTPYSGFFRARLDDSERMLLVATVNDSELPGSSHRVLVWLEPDGAGGWSEDAFKVRHDVLPGMGDGEFADEYGTNYYSFQIDNERNALYTVRIGGAGSATNGAIYYNDTMLVRKGDPSPLADSVYANIDNGTRADMSSSGEFVFVVNLSELPASENTAIVRGHIFKDDPHVLVVRQSEQAPGTGEAITGFGTGVPARINDAGEVIWFAVLTGGANSDQALFIDNQVLMRKGVTTIGEDVITTVAGTAGTGGISRGFTGSQNGRFVLVRTVLNGDTRAAVLVEREIGEPALPELEFDPSGLDFGDVEVGESSPPQTATLHNHGDTGATGLDFALAGGPFTFSTDCGEMLPAGDSCEVEVIFTPDQVGPADGVLEVTGDQDAGAVVMLAGNGEITPAPPVLEATPEALDFGAVMIGSSESAEITIRNAAEAPVAESLVLDSIGLSGSDAYSITGGDCQAGSVLAPQESCAVVVGFQPPEAGFVVAALSVSSADGQTASVDLAGTGTAPVPGALLLSPAELAFGEVGIGTAATGILTLTNTADTGAAAVLVSSIQFMGAAEFADTGNGICQAGATELEAGQSCTVEVSFTPSAEGGFAGSVLVAGGDGKSASAALSGSGFDPGDDIFLDRFEQP